MEPPEKAASSKHASMAGAGRDGCRSLPCDVQLAIMMRLAFEDPTRSLGATGPVL